MSVRHGNCNFRNLEFNTVCGCQEFTREDDDNDDGPAAGLLSSSGGRARKTCLCGHFVNFHTKHIDGPREHAGKKHLAGDSFRSARLRSGATSPTSIAALTNTTKPTPTTDQGHEYGDVYALSKTFEDPPARYTSTTHGRLLASSFGDAAGLGISLRTAKDTERSYSGRSGDSSAVTEVAPHLVNAPGRGVPQLITAETRREACGRPSLRSTRSSPLLGHQQMQQFNFNSTKGTTVDDATVASTVADSHVVTGQERYLEFDRRVNGALHIVRGLSQAFLPLHLQEGLRLHAPNSGWEGAPFIALDERESSNDELQRQTLAIEAQLRTLARTVAGRLNSGAGGMESGPRNRIEELPQSVPNESPVRQQELKSSPTKLPNGGTLLDPPEQSSSPPPALAVGSDDEVALTSDASDIPNATGVSESFVNKKFHDIVEKVDLQEELCNDMIKFKNDKEEELEELGTNVFSLEERLGNMEIQFNRFLEDREQSFRKRAHEDDDEESGCERKKRSKRRRQEAALTDKHISKRGADQPLDSTFKQTLTTTTSFTRTHSTSTSFASASSCSTATRTDQTALIKSLSSKIGVLQQRLQQIEAVAIPSYDRPWIVQVVVLPQSTWTTWRATKDGGLFEQPRVPKALASASRAWKRLHSRGLIKCLEITGGEARDVERTIRKAFGSVFSALSEAGEASAREDGPYEWSPLRKAPEQVTLRALSHEEMSKQFWKVDFLRGTCAEDMRTLTPSRSSPLHIPRTQSKASQAVGSPVKDQALGVKPTHRLYITNCWTGNIDASWDANTQASSAPSKRSGGSVFSTQTLRRRLHGDNNGNSSNSNSSSPRFGADSAYRSGWTDVRNLPPETVYIYDNKHEIASRKPRPAEDEAFWYYDAYLDGPREDSRSSREGSVSDTGRDVSIPKLAITTEDEHLAIVSGSSSVRGKSSSSQASQRLTTQLSSTLQASSHTLSTQQQQQQPLLVSQASGVGRREPSPRIFGDGDLASASPGMLSHDSQSTPRAQSFLGTPNSSFAHSAAFATAKTLRRSRRGQGSVGASGGRDGTQVERMSRGSTAEREVPASSQLFARLYDADEAGGRFGVRRGREPSVGRYA